LEASKDVQNHHFMYDLHPTEAGFNLIAQYQANLLGAQDGLAAQADIAHIAVQEFTGSIFDRLDAYRFSVGPGDRVAAGPVRLYLDPVVGSGDRDDRYDDAGGAAGFDYHLAGRRSGPKAGRARAPVWGSLSTTRNPVPI